MKNITLENLNRNIKVFVIIDVIFFAILLFIAVIMGLIISELLYAVLFAFGLIAIYSLVFLPFIIHFVKVKKRFKRVLRKAKIRRGILLGFESSFFRLYYGYMDIDGETYFTDSIYRIHTSAFEIGEMNDVFSLVNKEVSYVFDGEKIYLLGA